MVADPDFFKATTCPPPVIASLAQASICSVTNTDSRPFIRASDVIKAISSPCEPRLSQKHPQASHPPPLQGHFWNRAIKRPCHPNTFTREFSSTEHLKRHFIQWIGHHNHYFYRGFGTFWLRLLAESHAYSRQSNSRGFIPGERVRPAVTTTTSASATRSKLFRYNSATAPPVIPPVVVKRKRSRQARRNVNQGQFRRHIRHRRQMRNIAPNTPRTNESNLCKPPCFARGTCRRLPFR